MKIFHCAAEFAPFAKAGGIADVIEGLSSAQSHHEVTVIIPKYESLPSQFLDELQKEPFSGTIKYQQKTIPVTYFKIFLNHITLVCVEIPSFFDRALIYGYDDDLARFLAFCLACLTYIEHNYCDILHLHDWHTSFLSALVKKKIPTVLTIHNFAYLGSFEKSSLFKDFLISPDLIKTAAVDSKIYSLMQSGLVCADQIVAVSPSYAKELIQNKEHLLHSTLEKRKNNLTGILNGLNTSIWGSETDPYLPHYSLKQLQQTPPFLKEKEALKTELQKQLFLEQKPCFMMGMVSRLVEQKNPHLMLHALQHLTSLGHQVVLLGSTFSNDPYDKLFKEAQSIIDPKKGVIILEQNEVLAHQIFAACDLFFMPSFFEPCGLTQMIAMRYGTIPWVSYVGGLKDTVDASKGFLLHHLDPPRMKQQLESIVKLWERSPHQWAEKIRHCMEADFSWHHFAKQYDALYESL